MRLHSFGFALLLLMISCKTYTISPESFKEQFVKSGQNKSKEVRTNNPLSSVFDFKYLANDIKYLNVYDKNGTIFFMQNSPSVEMRVTLKNGKRKYFYFDTVTLENDTLKGGKSRILSGLENKIPFNDIVKIEIQDGGKNYYYKE